MSFVKRFEQQAFRNPNAIAMVFESRSLSYGELDKRSNRFARYLRDQGVGPSGVVAVCVERSLEAFVTILAVLKAGAGYLPLDPNYPVERLKFMLEDSKARVLVRSRGLVRSLPTVGVFEFELSDDVPFFSNGDDTPLDLPIKPTDLAYAIYTSGSTGTPKGVAMVHGALDNLIEWQLQSSVAREHTTTLQFAPLSFDVHFQEVFSTWCSGGKLVLVREEMRLEMLRLLELIEAEKVERLFLPFIALQSLADIAVNHHLIPKTLSEVITAGEQLQVTRAIKTFFEQLPGVRLFNHYGPSETHVVTSFTLEGHPNDWQVLPPIGKALPGVTLAILREDGSNVSTGEPGELYIGGVALARGYLHRAELTEERFVTLHQFGQRFYRTGDLVKELPSGDIQFLGRLDGQVKIRGYRIELGEIEVALTAQPTVREAAVTVRQRKDAEPQLVAYVVLESSGSLGSVRDAIQRQLPDYMLPSAFVLLPTLPRTPSGKIDKRSLPEPTRDRPELESEYVAPTTPAERTLSEIWSTLLSIDNVGIRDNFFQLGGNSLLALRAVAETEKRLRVAIPIVRFFECPTIEAQSAFATNPDASRFSGMRRVLHRDRSKRDGSAPIAIIGFSARLPGANSAEEFWNNLLSRVESITDFGLERLDPAIPSAVRCDPTYVPRRGIIDDSECFDAAFFGISPNEALVIDPQQRVLLELSWNALEHAGYAPGSAHNVIGVYAGTQNNTYFTQRVLNSPETIARVGDFSVMTGAEKDYVATRIAHKLDLTGPALSIHTACSTSLVALATAVQQLRAGLCDIALAGGASIAVPQHSGYLYQAGGMLSQDGHTKTFDANATGTVFSDGAVMLVLKPLDQAIADKDTVFAVIRGIGLNNDGSKKASFTAPSVEGQAAAISMAQDDAGVTAREIDYIEAHGTATPLGDPIEVEALTTAFRRNTSDASFCGIGSVKSNIGHTIAAAGAAGVLKTALSLYHEVLTPTLHFKQPNPKIPFENGPFYVVAETKPWPRSERVRRAGVSSFGVGGTNAHVILEEPPLPKSSGQSIAHQLLLLSAKSTSALERGRRKIANHFERSALLPLADAAYTLALGRVPFPEREAFVARDVPSAASVMLSGRSVAKGRCLAKPSELAFLFPGQGSQYVGMGRNLYDSEPQFRLWVDDCANVLMSELGVDIREFLFPAEGKAEEAADALKRTEITQSALFTVEFALAKTLISWNIKPSYLLGHSVGEFVAACLASVFDLPSALKLVATRGKLMQSMPSGSMLSVRCSVKTLLTFLPDTLDVASENGSELCVIGGPTDAIETFGKELEARGILSKLLQTSHAFHSRSMDAAIEPFRTAVNRVNLSAPRIPIVSTATGTWLSDAEATDPEYWARHLRRTVLFSTALSRLTSLPTVPVLLEVGPRKTLTTLALQRSPTDARSRPTAISTFADRSEDEAEWQSLLTALGKLWVNGIDIDFSAYYRTEDRRRVPLPGYDFERTRHWIDVTPANHAQPQSLPSLSPPNLSVPATSPIELTPSPTVYSNEVLPMSAAPSSRPERLVSDLKQLFEHVSGMNFQSSPASAHFLELGVDSLLVTQLATQVKQKYGVVVTFRHLMEEQCSFAALAEYLDRNLPADAPVAAPPTSASVPTTATTVQPQIQAPAFVPPLTSVTAPTGPAGYQPLAFTQQLIQLQVAQLQLLQQQLAFATGQQSSVPVETPPTTIQPAAAVPPIAPNSSPAATQGTTAASPSTEAHAHGQNSYDPQKAFGAIARIHRQSDSLTPKQQVRLQQLVERYNQKTGKSKEHTAQHRRHHADPRVVNGFKPRIKEIIYPIVTERAKGCRLWDLDGNEYVDALNGFGSNFFGYSAPMIAEALTQRIVDGFDIGPQTPFAGEAAALVCELTGMDRAAFCNTGSEAVMGALRIARTVTGRATVVAFSGSYHGIFDEVIVRDTKTLRPIPAAPGILPEAVKNMLILEYGTDESLRIIRERANDIAAVLIEPVQSRRPDFRPKEFIKSVREITKQAGCAMIFDEVITGFRYHPGGAQVFYGVEADLTTYGKVVGAGMPVGVIAGRDPWMDALDGGQWQYGDDSIPTAGVTYFAGTFVRHPLTMVAVHTALKFMKAEGPRLQENLNAATTRMADELNAFFKSVGAPLEIRHFASLWKTFFTEPQPYGELLFCYLRDRGVHIWDGFPCFLSLAHTPTDIAFIVDSFKSAVREMQAGDFLPRSPNAGEQSFDASSPPAPGARLGRDASGNPAWFVPSVDSPGKYEQLN